MITVHKHGKGWRIRWTDAEGKRCSETHSSRKDAELAAHRRATECIETKRGIRKVCADSHTFGQACDYWEKHRVPLKKSGKDDLYIIARYLRPELGAIKLRDLGRADFDAYKTRRRQHLKPRTISNHCALISGICTLAADIGWSSPAAKIKKPKIVALDTDYRYLRTMDEINRFLIATREHAGEMAFILYATAIYTGMRAGELAGLRWSCVDLQRQQIHVCRSYKTTTKSGRSRHVPIQDALLPQLRAWKLKSIGELVFYNQRGGMLEKSTRIFREVLHKVLVMAQFGASTSSQGDRYILFHSLRHTFASHWIMNGGSIEKLRVILGHSTLEMTLRYAHLRAEDFAGERARMPTVPACTTVVSEPQRLPYRKPTQRCDA